METETCRKNRLSQRALSLLIIMHGEKGNPTHTLFLVIFLTFSLVFILYKVSVHGRHVTRNGEMETEQNQPLKNFAELPGSLCNRRRLFKFCCQDNQTVLNNTSQCIQWKKTWSAVLVKIRKEWWAGKGRTFFKRPKRKKRTAEAKLVFTTCKSWI